MNNDDGSPRDPGELAADLVRFFRSLPRAVRAEYDALAALDREHGEDVGPLREKEGSS